MAWPRSRDQSQFDVQLPERSRLGSCFETRQDTPLYTDLRSIAHDAATHRFELLARVSDVPALGYTVLHAETSKERRQPHRADLRVDRAAPARSLSRNAHLKLTIDTKTGCITSLDRDSPPTPNPSPPTPAATNSKPSKTHPKQYDAWNIDPGTLDSHDAHHQQSTPSPSSPTARSARPSASRAPGSPPTSSRTSPSTPEPTPSSSTTTSTGTKPTSSSKPPSHSPPPAAKATYEIPYGSIERTTTRNNSWEKAKFEVPALRWADLGDAKQGLSILNDSKYGYDAEGNTLRLTLLRSATWPDEVADKGRQHFRYALYPHAGTWKQAQTVRRGYELNDPLKAEQVFPHTGTLPAEHSWASIENPNVTLTAIKKAEDSDALVFRMYEWAGDATRRQTPHPTRSHLAPSKPT